MSEKLLIAEDEKELAKAVKTILQHSGYEVTVTYNGKDALEKTKTEKFDVIIMDIMMPVMDGIEALKNMRKSGVNTPVILLTAKSQIDDKVDGLDSGANDYLTKPFDKKELLARIRALIRVNNEKKEKFNIGNLVFSKEKSEISNQKSVLHLNDKECEIMEILVKNQERNVTVDELSKKVWQTNTVEEGAVKMYISYLQDKFSALQADIVINDKNGYNLESKL